MDPRIAIDGAPPLLELGGDPAAASRLDHDLVAIEDGAGHEVTARFQSERLAVVPVSSVQARKQAGAAGPVYRMRGGGLAVPTGRVLVRFGSDDAAQAHAEALDEAGFQLEEGLRYAPQAAWVRPHSGITVDALRKLDALRSLPGVEHVEPQVLTAAAPRPHPASPRSGRRDEQFGFG